MRGERENESHVKMVPAEYYGTSGTLFHNTQLAHETTFQCFMCELSIEVCSVFLSYKLL